MARDTVTEIKNKLSIQDVVAPYVKLRKAGRSLVGLCPFHKEKTGSFHVSPERGSFHCFGCGVGGDAFTFIEKIEGVDFKGAMQLLAEKAGVEIVYDPKAKEASSQLERLRETLQNASQHFQTSLDPEGRAYAYALSRGLTTETIKKWQLGYAKDEWRSLLEALSGKGFSVAELKSAGLVKEADGKPGTFYDRFRGRLMFPIADTAGRTVAFTGRLLPEIASSGAGDKDAAKYLNSPETDLYHKSEILFGLDRAKDAIRTRGFAILVEGQLDLLHAHQAGFENTIALSGSAFSASHAKLLKRYSENLMLALDADSAGLTATVKSALIALHEGMRVKAVRLPVGKDPADVISTDPKVFAAAVKEAKSVVEFFLAVLGEREHDQHRLVLAVERVVLPLVRAIASPLERAHFSESVARSLGLSREAVDASIARLPETQPEVAAPAPPAPTPLKKNSREMRAVRLAAVVKLYPDSALAKRVEKEYARITEATLPPEVPEETLFRVGEEFGEDPSGEAADELLNAFEIAHTREAYQEAVQALRRAERGGDASLVAKEQTRVLTLSKRLSTLT